MRSEKLAVFDLGVHLKGIIPEMDRAVAVPRPFWMRLLAGRRQRRGHRAGPPASVQTASEKGSRA